jgi:hypothetical protein
MLAIAALTMVAVIGCSGTMNGVIRRDATRIDITYTDTRVSSAELFVVMPDGERFQGRTESLNKSKEMMQATADDISAHFQVMQTFDGNAKANLTGSRGNLMKCRFKLADYILGLKGGGYGLCQMADGRVIDVFF